MALDSGSLSHGGGRAPGEPSPDDRIAPPWHDAPCLLVDVWGVLHDGREAFDDALRFLERMHAQGVVVRLVSNASWTAARLLAHLESLGFDPRHVDAVFTAGDEARRWVRERQPAGVFYEGLAEPVPGVSPAPLADCDLVVFANLTPRSEQVLTHALEHDIPIVCANPDLAIWDRSGVPTPKAGSLARRFEALGAEVHFAGKPSPGIFRRAAPQGAPLIGDSPGTDLAGALAAGIPSIWLKRRPYEEEAALCARYRPSWVVTSLDEVRR